MMDTQELQGGDAQGSDPVELTVDQLIEKFRAGRGPVGAAAIIERLDAAEADARDGKQAVTDLMDLTEDLKSKLAAAEKATADAEAKAKAAKLSQGERTAKPRKVGLVKDPLSIEDLRKAIGAADKIEILFGDGKQDSGAAPVIVEGDAWSDHALGLMLRVPVEIHGPAHGSQPYFVRGYALLLDGKQVAWSERPEPLTVGAGQKYQLSNDIFF